MTVGFVMLAHQSLDRAGAVAGHLAAQGAPVVIHVDRRVAAAEYAAFSHGLSHLPTIRFAPRRTCRWGTWSIVEATIVATRQLMEEFPEVGHVFLTCGSALPLRPVEELRHYLASRPDTDFIESVTTEEVAWTVGGLDRERFTLSFPFAWKGQRMLFDAWVHLQRRFGIRRKVPEGIRPHLGSQWWCLTCGTLERMMADPDRERLVRFFRRVWIPDESYFQTVARRHSRRLESRSLTLAKFDFQGKPHVLYDDHLDLLRHSDRFMARKIWPHAEALYQHFLTDGVRNGGALADPARVDLHFARALDRRTRGRPGLYMQSRFPNGGWENGKSAAPYSIYEGFSDLCEDWPGWIGQHPQVRVHGHLYAPDRTEFAEGQTEFAGALSDIAPLRDYNPVAFLTNLVWNTRGERQCFDFGPADNQEITGFVAGDPNAHVSIVAGAWLVPLLRSGLPAAEVRKRAAEYQATEAAHIRALSSASTKARVRIWTLSGFLAEPGEVLRIVHEDLSAHGSPQRVSLPRLKDLSGLGEFLRSLRDTGMDPHIAGDLSRLREMPRAVTPPSRAAN
jgi:hypothetical protein